MFLVSMPSAFEWILIILFLIPVAVLPIMALVDIIRHKFQGSKAPWIVVVVLFGFVGAVLYYALGVKQKIKEPDTTGQ